MRKFISKGYYEHGEQQATEQGTNKLFTILEELF